ncbi:capsid protein [Streptomyces sp. NPDC046977]|uniref:capsid protein n=1 Tax=Streptomyces sp. NPDC046977 TaxID=3154703 RepID=UPI00340F7CA4
MALPTGNIEWPPPRLRPALTAMNCWDAWYGGDPERLTALYGGGSAGPDPKPLQYSTGVMGRFARWWWGTPPAPGEQRTKLHVPIAGDICGASSDLLFSEAPVLRAGDDTTQKRLDAISDEGMHASLQTAAEVAAALGGVYLRPVYDPKLRDRPWLDAVHHDRAVPEFTWGQLSAVTFWRILAQDNGEVWRHLERHEPGATLHGLYKGTSDKLGMLMPLEEHPATAGFASLVDEQGAIPTAYKGLDTAYIPNQNSRRWRGIPALTDLGRSDLESTEPLMDALDEAYASWMRDVRLAKGRIVVPNAFLQNNGPGKGASFNPDQEAYAGLDMLTKGSDGAQLTVVQFAIRVKEHQDTVNDLIDQILRTAGYSGQTFGRGGDVAVTATEVTARERRSMTTRGRKTLRWQDGLAHALDALLAVDAEVFRSGVTPQRPVVEFGDSVSEDPLTLANTIEALARAEAASAETKVRMLNPDWDDTLVRAETDRIMKESGRLVGDPTMPGAGGMAGGGFPG